MTSPQTPNDGPAEDAYPPDLRFLRRLVTVLTATMILGVLTIVILLVIRLNATPRYLQIPDEITLPQDVNAVAITRTASQLLVVTDQDTLIVIPLADEADPSTYKTISLDHPDD